MNQMFQEITNLKAQNKYLLKVVNRLENSQEDSSNEILQRIQKLETQTSESQTPESFHQSKSFDDIPKSCRDLNLIGHKLSGFYNVRGLGENVNKIETIFCKFNTPRNQLALEKKQPKENTLEGIIILSKIQCYFLFLLMSVNLFHDTVISEKRMGYVDIKTKSVYFYVQKNDRFFQEERRIPFEVVRLNIGNAFDPTNNVFIAPVSGTYFFSFSAINIGRDDLYAYLRVDGIQVSVAYATTYKLTEYNPTVMRSILNLEAGSKVDVWLKEGYIHDHNVENKGPHTHFVGWLLEEDLKKLEV